MSIINKLKMYSLIIFLLFVLLIKIFIQSAFSENNENFEINADKIIIKENGDIIEAKGNVVIETESITSKSEFSLFNKKINEIKASGNVIIKDELNNHYFIDNIITDQEFDKAIGSNIKIRMNDKSRIVGNLFSRQNSTINQIDNAVYTPCIEKNYIIEGCPGRKLNAKKVIHDVENKNIYYEGAILSILNVPVLYTPFFSHPDPTVKKRSGFLMPKVSSDNRLGTTLSVPFFYNASSNYDLTITPTIQTKADDYYTANYRHLTRNHRVDIDSSISSNESKTGTKNHFFLDGSVKNPFGKFDYVMQTSNNDTYLRKNYINDLTILTSGINFTKEMENSYLEFDSYIYKHLNNNPNQKWEYVYPSINYDIYNLTDLLFGLNWSIENSFLNYRDVNKDYNQQISSGFLSKDTKILKEIGLKFENTIQNRFVYFKSSKNDFNQLRVFPQISSKISYPLSKATNKRTELLEPIIMPIIAPFNNYSNDQKIDNSNIFALNRETSLAQWESGPRINYGINWLINYENFSLNTSVAQSAKLNNDNRSLSSNEISDYFIGNTIDLGNIGYIKTDITIDRQDFYLKDNNINTSVEVGKVKFGFDYDYETLNKEKTSEQISIGSKINLLKNTNIIASIRKDLKQDKSIGNAFGIHYENDCLAINFDYFRDFTAVGDIKNIKGFSFTITLKPFGTSKQAGKVKNFGPQL